MELLGVESEDEEVSVRVVEEGYVVAIEHRFEAIMAGGGVDAVVDLGGDGGGPEGGAVAVGSTVG